MRKTAINLAYQSVFQLMKILLPMITIPIVSNALGPKGIGVYNYTGSIAQYFVLLAGLGVGVYGNREISIVRENKRKMSLKFCELFKFSFAISASSLILYLILVSFSRDRLFFYLQSLIIIAAVFDISWFFMGIEDFKKISLSSLCAQLISFLGIIIFVKDYNDLGIYICIQGLNILLPQVIMWTSIKKKVDVIKVPWKDCFVHFIPAAQYLIPKVAIVLYTNLNKTLLGWLDSATSVGFYSNTVAINTILVTLITTIDLVLLPKFSNLAAKGNSKSIVANIKKAINVQLYITIPIMFGIISISKQFVPWFFGEKFLILINTMPIVAPLIVIIPLGMAIGRQYLVPMNKVKIYNSAVIVGAIISIVINIVFIPIIGVYGAVLATICAEFVVTYIRLRYFAQETGYVLPWKNILCYLFSGVLMMLVLKKLFVDFSSSIYTTFLQCLLGSIFYLVLTTILNHNPLLSILKKIIKR